MLFHPMIHSPSEGKGRCCTNLKPGARNFLPVFHMGAGSQGFESSLTAFPGHKQGAGWEVELPGLEQAIIWDFGVFKARTLSAMPCRRASSSALSSTYFCLMVLSALLAAIAYPFGHFVPPRARPHYPSHLKITKNF